MTFHQVGQLFVVSHATSPPFVSATSPKYVDRESLGGRRTGTRERKGTSPEMFVAEVRGRAIKCGNKKKRKKERRRKTKTEKRTLKLLMITRGIGMVEVSPSVTTFIC